MKYKAGQKVRVRRELKAGFDYGGVYFNTAMALLRGEVATIKGDVNNGDFYRLNEIPWTWSGEMFEPACIEKIVITSDGVTTTARKYDGKKIIKEAKAICSKDDTFNFDVGAKLAMERLMAEDKPKLYNGKVVCIELSNYSIGFTKGKIYRFAEGFTLDDDNEVRPATCIPIESFEDLERKHPGRWLEVVE